MSASQTSFCRWSGTRIATTCAPFTASATVPTVRPASSAAARDALPSRRPTCTSTPESLQVQRVRMPLAAEADDGDLAVEEVEVAVAVNGCHRC